MLLHCAQWLVASALSATNNYFKSCNGVLMSSGAAVETGGLRSKVSAL